MTEDEITQKAKIHLENSFLDYLPTEYPEKQEASFFTGYRLMEEGLHYSLKPNGLVTKPLHDFEENLNFNETPLANCASYLIRTTTPAEEFAAYLTRDYDPETSMDQLVFPGLTLSFVGDIEVSVSVVRPDLLFIFLQRVQKYCI